MAVRRPIEKVVNLGLFTWTTVEYEYFCSVTTLDWQPWSIHRYYGQRGASENWMQWCTGQRKGRDSFNYSPNVFKFTGDIRTHLMAIDIDQTGQFSEDGKTALSQLGLDFSCKSCHVDGGSASAKSDEQLKERALNYHARPTQ